MNLLLFGAPGTGKGTQSSYLISYYKLIHISTGDLFRKALRENTELGLQARSYMDRGDLVPDSIVIALIEEVLSPISGRIKSFGDSRSTDKSVDIKSHKGFILDGFPRTLAQAESLDSLLDKLKLILDAVLYLKVLKSVLVERIVGRRVAEKSGYVYHVKFKPPRQEGICDKSGEPLIHRNDDKEEIVKQRLKAYWKQTTPLIEYYRKKDILFELDGCGSPEEVFSRIKTVISTFDC
ncbi:MAG: nucleoside monophosphate kinase [Bdellovibrionales bacterium]|nr:nucleoside monophosphate kinase [Bdellovibrionales bacterium]